MFVNLLHFATQFKVISRRLKELFRPVTKPIAILRLDLHGLLIKEGLCALHDLHTEVLSDLSLHVFHRENLSNKFLLRLAEHFLALIPINGRNRRIQINPEKTPIFKLFCLLGLGLFLFKLCPALLFYLGNFQPDLLPDLLALFEVQDALTLHGSSLQVVQVLGVWAPV